MKYVSILLIAFTFIMGCSGKNANIKDLPESQSKAIQQELLDNWSDYDISYRPGVMVFDPKNDDKEILVDHWSVGNWSTVKDQETWTQVVNGTSNQDMYAINMLWGEPIREIWVRNQFYGYIITLLEGHYYADSVSVTMVDDNAVKLVIY